MNESNAFDSCPHAETLVLVQAVPVCQFDREKRLLVDGFMESMRCSADREGCEGLPAVSATVMSCSEALLLLEALGNTRPFRIAG